MKLLEQELKQALEHYKKMFNVQEESETTLQDFVMWMLGNHVVETDFYNPLFVDGKDAGRYERNNVIPKYTQEQYWAWLKENHYCETFEDLEDNCDWFEEDEEDGVDGEYHWDGCDDEKFWVVVRNGKIREITGYEPKEIEL